MRVYEVRDPAQMRLRAHPWVHTDADPTCRYYDFRQHPRLVNTCKMKSLRFLEIVFELETIKHNSYCLHMKRAISAWSGHDDSPPPPPPGPSMPTCAAGSPVEHEQFCDPALSFEARAKVRQLCRPVCFTCNIHSARKI